MQNPDGATVIEVGSDDDHRVDLSVPGMDNELLRRFAADCGIPGGLKVVVSTGSGRIREHMLPGPCAVIGTAPHCNVRVEGEEFADRHAVLLSLEGRLFGCDLSTAQGTRYDGRLITKTWLTGLPSVEIGKSTVTVVESESAETVVSSDAERIQLELSFGNGRQAYKVRGEVLLIGQDARCKLQYRHPSVAGVHAAIVCTRTTAWLVDFGSSEGIILDGLAVRLAPLKDGSVLTIGDKEVEVRLGSAAEKVAPPVPAVGAVSEGFVLEVLERFQDSQRQLLDEMRTWTKDFSHALIESQHAQSQQLQGERQEMRREFVELMRIMAQRLPGPAPAGRRAVVRPDQPDQRLPAPPPQLPAPKVAPTADAEERLEATHTPDELRKRLQAVEEHLESQQGWLGSLLRRSPR
ncbi:MAG: FHA domain-containing protein [Planctomycetaceae bacterium]|nr:FHA domain-containing protein [Planctomycetaceae bacterium]